MLMAAKSQKAEINNAEAKTPVANFTTFAGTCFIVVTS